MVSSNINSNRIIHEANTNEAQSHHLDLTNEYITSNGGGIQIVNYLPNEILHHQLGMRAKEPNQIMHVYATDASSAIITSSSSSLPLLTPLKYVEYMNPVTVDEQMIITNDDSEKSDCESINELHKTPLKHVKRNLPHKKRIAKKLNSNQNYGDEQFSIIMPAEETTLRNIQPSNVRNCDFVVSTSLNDFYFIFLASLQHLRIQFYRAARLLHASQAAL